MSTEAVLALAILAILVLGGSLFLIAMDSPRPPATWPDDKSPSKSPAEHLEREAQDRLHD